MNVHEAHRTRHLMIRLDRGDELPAALIRALDEAEARSGFITGVGSVEAAELAHYDQAHTAYERARRIDAPCEVVSLSGNVALLDGAATVRLSTVLARETEVGLSTQGGQLVWARVFSLEIHVVVFDDLSPSPASPTPAPASPSSPRARSRPPPPPSKTSRPARPGRRRPAHSPAGRDPAACPRGDPAARRPPRLPRRPRPPRRPSTRARPCRSARRGRTRTSKFTPTSATS